LKRLLFLAAATTAITAAAIASELIQLRSFGQGRAANAHHAVSFRFDVDKVTHRGETHLKGSLLVDGSTPHHPGPRLAMHRPLHLTTDGPNAMFSGPGTLRVPVSGGYHEHHGHVQAHVTSRRHPGEIGPRDIFRVQFTKDNVVMFSFEGELVDGDLSVNRLISY
jgi:hypothetical protein